MHEWEFTPQQIYTGEIDYDLEDFYEQLRESFSNHFKEMEEKKTNALVHICYQTYYFTVNNKSKKEIAEKLRIKLDFAEVIIENGKEDIAILRAILMGKFLKNLQTSGGILSDHLNIQLLNAELKHFHKKHNL